MKTKPHSSFLLNSFVLAALALANNRGIAATIVKLDNTDDLNLTSSWTGGIVPGAFDVASWSGLAGANSTLLGANLSLQGITIGTTGGAVTLQNGNTLTLGTSGIDMSAATQDLTISSNLTLAPGGQVWNVASGRTLTLNTGTFSRSTGATLLIDKSVNTGTVAAANLSNTNGIVGGWAIIKSSGTAANNSANGFTFATKDGSGNLVAYTAATSVTTSYPANSSTINYDWSSAGTQAQIGSSRAANTIRYTGTGVVQTTNSTQTQTFNALMNAGTGLVSLGGGSIMNIRSATGELVLAAMTSGITINGPIIDNGATAGAVTILGGTGQTVTLGGTSTFTGNLTINSGTLAAGTGQGAAPTASNLGALQPAANRNITVNNGGILSLTGGNVLGTGGSTNTLSNTTLVVNAGGLFRTGLDAAGTGWWNKIGATNLNGGTIRVGSGANNTVFQGIALIGTVTVGGNSASTIENFAASNSTTNGVHLGQNATAGQSITFDVADVTGSSASDLNVSAKLLNTSSTLTASGITKTGVGTLTLSATNAYTGATTISGGTLQIGNGTTDGSIAASSTISNNAALVYNLTGAQSYANGITGTGTVTKAGAGAFTLGGTNSYSGATTVNGGSLILNGTLTSNIAVNTGGTVGGTGSTTGSLTLNAGSIFSGNTSGIFTANGVSFTGPTGLVFNGATTNGSTYDLFNYGAGGVTGLGNITSTFRATLVDDTDNTKVTATISTGNRTWNTTSGTWQSASVATNWLEGDQRYFDGDTVTFGDPAADSTVTLAGTVLPAGTVTVDNTNAYTFGGAGGIGGIAGLTKNGSGILNIATTNSYSGATAITNGTVNLSGAISGTAVSVASGASLNVSSLGAITGGSSLTTSGTVSLAGANTYTGATTINAGTTNLTGSLSGTAITLASGATLNVSGAGVIAGASSLAINGSLVLTNANTYSGATTIGLGGFLTLGDSTTDGSISNSSGITNNGSLVYNLTGPQSYGNAISGTGSVTKQSGGTLTLSGANTYQGGTTISNGAVTLTGTGSLGSGNISIANGATLNINRSADYANSATVTGGGAIVTTSSHTITGDFSGFQGTYTHNTSGASTGLNTATATGENANYVIAAAQGSSQGMIAAGNGDYTLKMGSLSGVVNSLLRGGNTATGTTTLEIGNLNTDTTFIGSINNVATKTLALTKVGTGAFTLGSTGSTSNFTGATLVNGGRLNLVGALSATSGLTIGTGASVSLGASDLINNSAGIHLNGGTLLSGGFNETVGVLTITGDNFLDFGAGTSTVKFADSSAATWSSTLTVWNWTGNLAGGGTDQLFFGDGTTTGLTSGQLGKISFYDGGLGSNFLGTATFSGTGNGELVPVPEPTALFAVLGVLAAAMTRRRS